MSVHIDPSSHESLIEDGGNVGSESLLKKLFQMLTGLVVLLVFLVIIYVTVADFVIVNLPDTSVQRIHQMARNIPLAHVHNPPEKLKDYLDELLSQLVSSSELKDREFELLLVKSSQINAFAYPGNRVVLTSELLKTVKSRNELAMVLGHELGHFSSRDNLKAFSKQALALFLFGFLLPKDMVASNLEDSFQSSVLKFSRLQESKADSYALYLVSELFGGNSSGVIDFFNRDEGVLSSLPIAQYLSTHPIGPQRVEALTKLMNQLRMEEKGLEDFPEWWEKDLAELSGVPLLEMDEEL